MSHPSPPAAERLGRLVPVLLLAGLLGLAVRCAWQSDDAYITFRTVENALGGHGLTWNAGERVQSYTHPLWMLLALACRGLFGEVYYSTLALSLLLALAAAALLVPWRRADPWAASAAVLLPAVSGAFVDYATSGLETPLLYLLLVLFVREAVGGPAHPGRRLSRLALLAAALGLARLDALLLAAPALAGAAAGLRPRREALRRLLAGLSPLAAWEAFSLVYYGSLVPNTALAKLNLAIPAADLLRQGARYALDSLRHDPVTLGATGLALVVAVGRGGAARRLVAAGIGLHLLYVLRIGGDFMSGRFFAAPFVAAAALLARTPLPAGALPAVRRLLPRAAVVALAAYGLLWPQSRWRPDPWRDDRPPRAAAIRPSGIADERAYYHPYTGLLPVLAARGLPGREGLPVPPYPGAVAGLGFARSPQRAAVWNEVGFFGYFAGDRKVVIDAWALCDPLLARLPFRPDGPWRVGHYPRRLPAGYFETRATGVNRIEDPGLAAAWDGLQPILRGPLFTARRWREIWRFASGFYASRLGREDYR